MKKKDGLKGLQFCVTGKIPGTKNQSEIKELIASYGGKTTQTVSPNTDYLIYGIQVAKNIKGELPNNAKRALDLKIPVLTYDKLLLALQNDNGKELRDFANKER